MTDPARARIRAAARRGEPFPLHALDDEPECECRWPEPGPIYWDWRCVLCGHQIPTLGPLEWIRRRILGRPPR
jgi:hypothetical protein